MKSTLICLLALASSAAAMYKVELHHATDSSKWVELYTHDNTRICFCTRDVQTGWIKGNNGGVIKLFKSNDCTGAYSTIGSNERINGATWVNSISFGKGGISSDGPSKDPSGNVYCPNWY
ncbi:hypothetical protein DFQ26_000237 [Actinomortierella ambigua]|nr:hypothetical protein DFQ26_000237 [Actinomortierella ambigua]